MINKLGWLVKVRWVILLAVLSFFDSRTGTSQEVDVDFSGYVGYTYQHFINEGLYEGQRSGFPSFSFEPELNLEWDEGEQSLNMTGFARLNFRDNSRTHFDIRELYYQRVKNDWELSIGLKKIYWGVTEAVHLVDIINQTDQLETFDGEQKLGQPMVHYSLYSPIGTIDLFYLPYFRKRSFVGERGRLRTPFILESDDVGFESDMEETRPGFAFRWSHYIGAVDIGVSHFYGNGREPLFLPGDNPLDFNIFYPVINQTGFDLQATTGPILWKYESIYRQSQYQDMFAMDIGLEYTIGNIGGKGLDIGIITEYLYDDRGDLALSGMQSDLFVGSRLAFNDTQSTQFLFGGIIDLERSTRLVSVEGSRRLGESWTFDIEMRLFQDVSQKEFLNFFRDDSFLQFTLERYF
ncbi:MAG: hypothetical protein ACJA2S_001267 [Cyclobacteriaceae bacterium]|jgi:hypothetical protein